MLPHPAPKRIAIAGLGAIGLRIAEAIDKGLPGCELVAVSANNRDKARERLAHLSRPVPVVGIEELKRSPISLSNARLPPCYRPLPSRSCAPARR